MWRHIAWFESFLAPRTLAYLSVVVFVVVVVDAFCCCGLLLLLLMLLFFLILHTLHTRHTHTRWSYRFVCYCWHCAWKCAMEWFTIYSIDNLNSYLLFFHDFTVLLAESIFDVVACSHMRSIYLYTESINSPCPFYGYRYGMSETEKMREHIWERGRVRNKAMFEVVRTFGQEQYGQRIKTSKVWPTDQPTDKA